MGIEVEFEGMEGYSLGGVRDRWSGQRTCIARIRASAAGIAWGVCRGVVGGDSRRGGAGLPLRSRRIGDRRLGGRLGDWMG